MDGGDTSAVLSQNCQGSYLRSLTVRQMLQAIAPGPDQGKNGKFTLDGVEFVKVQSVALILSADHGDTKATFTLDDGSGEIKATLWSGRPVLREGAVLGKYVRVVGKLSSYQGKNRLELDRIRPVENSQEAYYHMLEVVVSLIQLQRGPYIAEDQHTSDHADPVDDIDASIYMPDESSALEPGLVELLSGASLNENSDYESARADSDSDTREPDDPQSSTRRDGHQHLDARFADPNGSSTFRITPEVRGLRSRDRARDSGPSVAQLTLPRDSAAPRDTLPQPPTSVYQWASRQVAVRTPALPGLDESYPDVSDLQRAVIRAIQQSPRHPTEGVARSELLKRMRAFGKARGAALHTEEDCADAIEWMLQESYIFSPIDSDHFEITQF